MIRLGLIGAGRWGRNYIKTIAALDGIHLTRVASRNPETYRLVSPDTTIDLDWRALIVAGDLDGVIIATPPALHIEMARAAIVAGLPVLIEKPLTLNLCEAFELRDYARVRGSLVMVDHTHLFHPAFEELCHRLPQLGVLRMIRGRAGGHGPYRADTPVLWDWGSHDVAMCLAIAGTPPLSAKASVEATNKINGYDAETIRIVLEFSGRLTADICISNMVDKLRQFLVSGEGGTLVYDNLATQKLVFYLPRADPFSQGGEPIAISSELPLQRAVNAFAVAIANRQSDLSSLDGAVEVVKVLDHCARGLSTTVR